MARVLKGLTDLLNLSKLSRAEIYARVKPTIDAANKRLRRQGSDIRLSTRGKGALDLLEVAKQAIGVPPKQPGQARGRVARQLPQDFEKMKRTDLAKNLQPTIDAANKRLQRLQAMKTLSPALNSVMDSGGKFSFRGKSRNELLKEASRAIAFVNMKTSTVAGARSFEKGFAAKLSNKAKDISNDQRKLLFDSFRKLQQISPVGLNIYGSDRLIRMLADEIVDDNYTFEATMQRALSELNSAYEQFQMDNDEMNPFDI